MFFTANITFTFTWYANGNVFSDGNMTVAYYDNRLNLPNYIQFAGNRVIQNTYAADGRKLHSSVRDGSTYKDGTKYYNGNLVLDKNKKLEYILFDDGRIVHNNGNFTYEYHLKDHLGSVRVAFEPSANGATVVQENAYYPFGAPIAELSWSGSSTNRYKHTGMETLCDFPNAGYVDNGARWRGNPFAPGFLSIDPLAEKYYNSSPYAYCNNNPVRFIDPTGKMYTDYRNEQGELLYKTDDGLTDVIIVKNIDIPKLEHKLNETHANGTINDPETNKREMHTLGRTPQVYSEESTKGMDDYWVLGYKGTYEKAYKEGTSQFSLGQLISSIIAAIATENNDNSGEMHHGGRMTGISEGNKDRESGIINRLNPYSSFKDNKPLLTIPKPELIKKYPGVGLPPM